MTKAALRAALRASRTSLVERRKSNDFVSEILSKLLIKLDIEVAFYQAIPAEPDVTSVLISARPGGEKLSLPAVNSKSEPLTFRRWRPGDVLDKSPLGFAQPPASCPQVTPQLILTPLLGFDRTMARLGQGAGHYDRAFAEFPGAYRIGIAWSAQEVEGIPCDPWDVPMDIIVTERDWITGPKSRLDFLT